MSYDQAEEFYNVQYSGEEYANVSDAKEHPYYPVVSRFVADYCLSNKHCLEIGCGRGAFQDIVDDWVGIEISTTVARHLHKPFVACDATQHSFRDDEFDAIWSVTTLEHIPNPQKALEEMRRKGDR